MMNDDTHDTHDTHDPSEVPVEAIVYWIEQGWDLSGILRQYLIEHHPDALSEIDTSATTESEPSTA